MKKMDSNILEPRDKKSSNYYLDKSMEEMKEYIEKYSEKIREYVWIMKKYEGIVIYGSGNIGKSVFDLIEPRKYLKFHGFAVSSEKPEGTARGRKIYCINQYLDRKDKALLVIAGEKRISDEMEETARKLGFKNRLIINEELIDTINFAIVNDKFAM
ncbi:MAG: hypothetical protein K2K70_11705 [Lachnospiraceae bacterium]|nr:hypothetical protein [Lachnospiraceae bacterium]